MKAINHITNGKSEPQQSFQLQGKVLHFVGVGGCGMSGLARLAHHRGALCSGTDLQTNLITQALEAQGIGVSLDQSGEAIPNNCDVLVVSAAIKEDHPEVKAAKKRGITQMKYAKLLGQLMIGHTGIAIAGTHGKSTTTAMLSHILIATNLDPSFIVGATCEQIGGGARVGKSDLLIAEACEYDRSFHNFFPAHAAILNVEEDHLDIYDGLESIVESFSVFAKKIPDHGSLLIQHELPSRLTITGQLHCKIQTIGFAPQADWYVQVIEAKTGKFSVKLHHQSQCVAQWPSPMPGEHMAYNAAVAAVIAHKLGAPWLAIAKAIEQFQGLDRRMQHLGTHNNVQVIDDYGHHPTEIETTLRALRQHEKPNRLICVFQPHQHSRTRFLMDQFAASFSQADIVIIPDIYFVRDSIKERHAVRAADLVDRLRQRGIQAMHLYPFDAIAEQLSLLTRPGDLLVTMGAGTVWQVARKFINLQNK